MHLVGPYLSMSGKKKGKQKFKSSAQAQQARELAKDWEALKSKWGATTSKRKQKTVAVDLPTTSKSYIRDTATQAKSLNSWVTGAVTSKQSQQYTGNIMLGIGTLHKSNAVPIFSNQEATDIAKMRR